MTWCFVGGEVVVSRPIEIGETSGANPLPTANIDSQFNGKTLVSKTKVIGSIPIESAKWACLLIGQEATLIRQ